MNSKNLLVDLLLTGGTFFASARTTHTASTTVVAAQQNPNASVIDNLKNRQKPIREIPNLAIAYQEAADWTNAVDTWKKISALLPDWAPSYYSQAYAYRSAKDDTNAKLVYEKYIASVKPEEIQQNKKNLAYAYFYVAFSEQQNHPDSEGTCCKIFEI